MMEFTDIDDHMLGAFVDGQLDSANSEAVLKAVDEDPEVRERIYQLRRSKDLMKLGFDNAKAPSQQQLPELNTGFLQRCSYGIAASIMTLALGFGSGILYSERPAEPKNTFSASTSSIEQPDTDRVVLHISESSPKQFAAALTYVEDFLDAHETPNSQIEVIANSGGLDLMREDLSPFKKRVIAMINNHDNVHFIACANGIRNLIKQGQAPKIIPDIDTEKTAIDHIIGRLQSGWTYVKVDSLPEI